MTNKIDIYSKYNETIEAIRLELDPILKNQEEAWIASFPEDVREKLGEDARGHYKRDLSVLLALITPEQYAACLETYDPNHIETPFHMFLLEQVAEQVPAILCNTLPAIFGDEHVEGMIRFFVGARFPDLTLTKPEQEKVDWDDHYTEFFQKEIGEIGTRKLQKLEI